jgi:hypothetical protein
MNRVLVPAAVAALLAGCARPSIPGPQTGQPFYDDSAVAAVAAETTVVVREVAQEVPVYYADTVYLEGDPQPADTVYVEESYESETYVFVSGPEEPPHQGRRHEGWPPREGEGRRGGRPKPEPRPRIRPGDDGSLPPGQRAEPEPPTRPEPTSVRVPQKPPRKTGAPVVVQPVKSPDRPTPPVQPTPAKYQAPAKDDTLVTIPARNVRPIPADRNRGAEDGD